MKSKSVTFGFLLTLHMLVVPGIAGAGLIGTLEETSPNAIAFTPGIDFVTFNSPSSQAATGDVTGMLFPVDLGSNTSGCEPADFWAFAAGSIAVVTRGTCTFATKTLNAQNAGASGILIVNQLDVLGSGDGLSMSEPTTIPALLVDDDIGAQLVSFPRTVVHMSVERVADVPAPASIALLGIGLAGLGWNRRRRPGLSLNQLPGLSHV